MKIPNYEEWLFSTERGNEWLYFCECEGGHTFDDNPTFSILEDIEFEILGITIFSVDDDDYPDEDDAEY